MALSLKISLLLFVGICLQVRGNQYCMQDSDCGELGDELICIKSACEWGICACKRGYVSRYVGSDNEFKCLKMARIGEECTTDDDEHGVCAAEFASCVNEECVCDALYESRSDGETCVLISAGVVFPTESCSPGLGDTCQGTSCSDGAYSGTSTYSGNPLSALSDFPLDKTPGSCDCGVGYHTELPNDYSYSPFIGAKVPTCAPNAVGDLCMIDEDCGEIQKANGAGGWTTTNAATCSQNLCTCQDNSHSPDITGLFCATALSYGDQCMVNHVAVNSDVGVCDGTQGLRCGSPCDLTTLYGSGNFTCVCDPSYSTSGTTCSANAVGSSCNGDQNCKAIGLKAVCRDSLCESGAATLAVTMVTIMASVMTTLLLVH